MTRLKKSLLVGQSLTPRSGALVVGAAFILLGFLLALTSAPRVMAQIQNGISEPQDGAALSGVVTITGTATDDQFLRYEIAFSTGGDWLVFAEGNSPVTSGTLALWDTTVGQPTNPVFPDGVYHLRLRVVRQDYNYDEYFVSNLTVNNAMTPTPTETATPEAGSTPGQGTAAPQPSATSGFIIVRPSALPSLTPFPSPSVPAVPGGEESGTPLPPSRPAPEGGGGLMQRLLSFETERFGRAFWAGVQLALLAFTLLAIYVVVRALFRFIWPRIWIKINRQE